jgi:UDP-N-acetylglucosamine transferase subunit ALG13
MIFITLGTQLSFDRLIDFYLDSFNASDFISDHDVVIQGELSDRHVKIIEMLPHIKHFNYMTSDEYAEIFSCSDLIISHLGMGTVITAVYSNKPIICVPRTVKYGEHRNDHQLDAASYFNGKFSNVRVVSDFDVFLIEIAELLKFDQTKNRQVFKSELAANLYSSSIELLRK